MINISEIERKILEYIAANPYCIADDIWQDIFNGEEKKKSSVYKYLTKFKKAKLINSRLIDESLGTRSAKYIYLLTNGSRALGIVHRPVSKRDFSIEVFKKLSVRKIILDMCKQKGWELYEDNNDCIHAIADYLRYLDRVNERPVQPDQVYFSKIPKKVSPDRVLAKHGEYVILIVCDIKAGIKAFSDRIIKYKDIFPSMRCIAICMNEYQKKEWLKILKNRQPRYLNYQIVHQARGFLVLTYDEVEEIENYLENP